MNPSPGPGASPAWQLEPGTAEAIAQAVKGCPGVASLSPGEFGEVATYLAGRRVVGVRLRESIEVHVVALYDMTVEDVARQVRVAVAAIAPGRRIDVYVDDIDLPRPEGASDGGVLGSDPTTAAFRP